MFKTIIKKALKEETGYAFQPGSHFILMETVAKTMNDGVVKEALNAHRDIAAWGADGPDLGLIQLGELFGYSPWSCNFHYFKTGDFCKTMLEKALESGDLKKIAFAAGWVTHCCGDMGCHGIFVNPEAGVYLDEPEGRPLHMALEKNAEPVLWVEKGGYTPEDYKETGIAVRFSSASALPFDLLAEACEAVHGSAPSDTEMRSWVELFHLALKTGVGYKYTSYAEAKTYLGENGRYERLMKGFESAQARCLMLLNGAQAGDYSEFKNRWNLDVGRSDSPVSNLHVLVKTASQSLTDFGSGTDDFVYFGLNFKDGRQEKFELSNGKMSGATVNDFEAGQKDKFYLYIDRASDYFKPEEIESVFLEKKEAKWSVGGDWKPEYIHVYMNGVLVVDETINTYITDEAPKWVKAVNIVGVPSQPDPADPVLA